MCIRDRDLESTRIGEVMAGYPAEELGLRPGDVVKAVSGVTVGDWAILSSTIREKAALGPVELTFERDGVTHELQGKVPMSPEYKVPLLGIRPSMKRYPFIKALSGSLGYIGDFSIDIVKGIWSVSYTHLDVYKRQTPGGGRGPPFAAEDLPEVQARRTGRE